MTRHQTSYEFLNEAMKVKISSEPYRRWWRGLDEWASKVTVEMELPSKGKRELISKKYSTKIRVLRDLIEEPDRLVLEGRGFDSKIGRPFRQYGWEIGELRERIAVYDSRENRKNITNLISEMSEYAQAIANAVICNNPNYDIFRIGFDKPDSLDTKINHGIKKSFCEHLTKAINELLHIDLRPGTADYTGGTLKEKTYCDLPVCQIHQR